MAIRRAWDIQAGPNWWLSLGFHVDHTDPSVTLHLPGVIVAVGRLKQPGFTYSARRWIADGDPQKHRACAAGQHPTEGER